MLLTDWVTRQEDLKKGNSTQEKLTTAILLRHTIILQEWHCAGQLTAETGMVWLHYMNVTNKIFSCDGAWGKKRKSVLSSQLSSSLQNKTMDLLEYSVTEARARLEGAGNQIE